MEGGRGRGRKGGREGREGDEGDRGGEGREGRREGGEGGHNLCHDSDYGMEWVHDKEPERNRVTS